MRFWLKTAISLFFPFEGTKGSCPSRKENVKIPSRLHAITIVSMRSFCRRFCSVFVDLGGKVMKKAALMATFGCIPKEGKPTNPNPDHYAKKVYLNPNPLCSHSSHYYFGAAENLSFFVWWSPGLFVLLTHFTGRSWNKETSRIACRGHDSCKRSKRHPRGIAQVGLLLSIFIPRFSCSRRRKKFDNITWRCFHSEMANRVITNICFAMQAHTPWNSTYEYACTPGKLARIKQYEKASDFTKRPTPAMLWLTAKRKSCTFSKPIKSGLIRRMKRIFWVCSFIPVGNGPG